MRAWITYTILRLLVFAVILTILLLVRVDWPWATVIAALAGLALSYIFFKKQRDAVALEFAHRREHPGRNVDIDEDDALDRRLD